jgi:hypothetical protein
MGFSFQDDLPKCQLEEVPGVPEISSVARKVPVLIILCPKSTWAVRVESGCDAMGSCMAVLAVFDNSCHIADIVIRGSLNGAVQKARRDHAAKILACQDFAK